jgi:hypothetical protein
MVGYIRGAKFFDSAKLGKQYQNDMFVRDNNSCKLYDFKLNQSMTGVILNGTLSNK